MTDAVVEPAADPAAPDPAAGVAVPRRRPSWIWFTIAILFALFYVYDLFEAISNVVGVTSQITLYNEARAVVKLDPVPIPWGWLVVDVLLAPVVYTSGFLLARRRGVLLAALVFFVGLAAVAAMTLSVEALA